MPTRRRSLATISRAKCSSNEEACSPGADMGLLYFAPMQSRISHAYWSHWPPDMPRSLRAPRMTLQRMFLDAVAKHAAKTASIFQGEALSYESLKTRAEHLAGHLQHAC